MLLKQLRIAGRIASQHTCVPGLLVAICFAGAATSAGSTLDDYVKRTDRARVIANDLFQSVGKSTQNPAVERGQIAEIAKAVPPTEKIEWTGGSLDTGNQWLTKALDEFSAEPDIHKRQSALTEVSERLLAITESTKDLEKATEVGRAKDEDEQKLKEILSRQEYQKLADKGESLFQKWLKEFLAWLARIFPKPAISPEVPSGFGSLQFLLQILIYLIVIGLIGLLLYKFGPLIAKRFGSRPREKQGDRVILGERVGRDESARDLFADAERLAREGKLREAVRKGYIAVLCELSDKKMIGLGRHKTNRDYLRDIRKRVDLLENMLDLTRTYERNWYGLRPSEQDDWENFRNTCRQTVAKV